MEKVSTGGTRHEAQYKRPQSGQMNGSERMAKARARTSLFPDEAAAAREQNAGRMAAVRTAERTLFAETQQSQQILAGLADEAADVPAPTPAPAPLPHGLHLGPCLDADEPPLGHVLMFDSQEEERRYVTPSCSMFSVGMCMSRQCVLRAFFVTNTDDAVEKAPIGSQSQCPCIMINSTACMPCIIRMRRENGGYAREPSIPGGYSP